MTTEQALNDYFSANGLLPEGCTRDDWYAGHAIPYKIGGVTVGVFPILRREGPIVLHDLHHMLTGCALMTALFLGGWLFPYHESAWMAAHPIVYGVCGMAMFVSKMMACTFVMIWVRWTLPRFRYDQLMALGWKRLLPLSLACVVFTAFGSLFFP